MREYADSRRCGLDHAAELSRQAGARVTVVGYAGRGGAQCVQAALRHLGRFASHGDGFLPLGPVPEPHSRTAGRRAEPHRRRRALLPLLTSGDECLPCGSEFSFGVEQFLFQDFDCAVDCCVSRVVNPSGSLLAVA
jgi:hypothetical protein